MFGGNISVCFFLSLSNVALVSLQMHIQYKMHKITAAANVSQHNAVHIMSLTVALILCILYCTQTHQFNNSSDPFIFHMPGILLLDVLQFVDLLMYLNQISQIGIFVCFQPIEYRWSTYHITKSMKYFPYNTKSFSMGWFPFKRKMPVICCWP